MIEKETHHQPAQTNPQTNSTNEKSKPKSNRLILFCCLGAVFFIIILIVVVYLVSLRGFFRSSEETLKNAANQSQNKAQSNSQSQASYPSPQDCSQVQITQPTPLALNPDNPGLKTDAKTYYYKIYGSTSTDLAKQMVSCGPKQDGNPYDAFTWWMVNWQYYYDGSANSCNVRNVTVGVEVSLWYPQWQEPQDYQKGLKEKWDTFMTNLETHENGHKQHGIDAGQEIVNTLSNLPNASSCDAMGAQANTTANEIISKYNSLDKSYDDTTDHGRTQGAVFP